ncbi:MAG: YitT family protein [Bacteroidales bacterium]|nr:YitT family protein [Bacteroidales bacterium]
MTFVSKEKFFSVKWFRAYLLIVVGAFIMASGFVLFITPHNIVPGGVYGISIVIHHFTGFPIGMTALAFDIPLTIIGIRILGPRFGVKTVVGFILTAVFVDGLTYLFGVEALVPDDVLLSSVFGGVFIGLGLGLIFRSKATSGGSDIVAMIISRYTKLPLGQLMIYVDSAIVITGLFAFQNWKIPLYSLIAIYITGRVVDLVLQGVSYEKTLFIISEKHAEIRNKIIHDLNRGGTFLKGEGMYNGKEKSIIYTVLTRRELAILQDFIHKTDPEAFLTVINANEILGKGFKSLNDKVSD